MERRASYVKMPLILKLSYWLCRGVRISFGREVKMRSRKVLCPKKSKGGTMGCQERTIITTWAVEDW